MGYVKGIWERANMTRYGRRDKYICPSCIDDYAIREFIRQNAVEHVCSYCDNRESEPAAARLGGVVEFILEGIWTEWDDPVNCVGWEGGWVGAEVIDSDELIRYRVGLDYSNEEVLQDIAEAIGDHEWCQRDPYGLRTEEALIFSWNSFCEQVKHRSRYIFLRVDGDEEGEQRRFQDLDEIPVSKMLDRISWEMSKLEYEVPLMKSLPICTKLWRVRIHNEGETFNTARDLGTVPSDKAKYSNRMSPAGIPMFYGALDPETALKETIDTRKEPGKVASIATFRTLREIRVLDLSELPKVQSLFDSNRRHMRSSLMFMHSFVADLGKPVSKDGLEHIDYVPTQVFTEYIRYLYVDIEGNRILGIMYPSVKRAAGKSIVLFLENEHCCDEYQNVRDSGMRDTVKYLLLERVERQPLNKIG